MILRKDSRPKRSKIVQLKPFSDVTSTETGGDAGLVPEKNSESTIHLTHVFQTSFYYAVCSGGRRQSQGIMIMKEPGTAGIAFEDKPTAKKRPKIIPQVQFQTVHQRPVSVPEADGPRFECEFHNTVGMPGIEIGNIGTQTIIGITIPPSQIKGARLFGFELRIAHIGLRPPIIPFRKIHRHIECAGSLVGLWHRKSPSIRSVQPGVPSQPVLQSKAGCQYIVRCLGFEGIQSLVSINLVPEVVKTHPGIDIQISGVIGRMSKDSSTAVPVIGLVGSGGNPPGLKPV